jgi:Domain of unknown function (DUF4258)
MVRTVAAIQEQFASDEVEFSNHAVKQMRLRGISVDEVFEAVQNAECIEIYPDDKYGASVLLCGFTLIARPLHIVVTASERPFCKVITAYQPNPEEWEYHRVRKTKP